METLEAREVPATIQWAAAVSGDFNTGANWIGGVVPGNTDVANIPFAGITVFGSSGREPELSSARESRVAPTPTLDFILP